jgi:hypothetical protein
MRDKHLTLKHLTLKHLNIMKNSEIKKVIKFIEETIEFKNNPYTTWHGYEEKFSDLERYSIAELVEKIKYFQSKINTI